MAKRTENRYERCLSDLCLNDSGFIVSDWQGLGSFTHLDLLCATLENDSYEVAEISFNFWYNLSELIYRMADDELNEQFSPYVQRVIISLCKHIQLDPDLVSLYFSRSFILYPYSLSFLLTLSSSLPSPHSFLILSFFLSLSPFSSLSHLFSLSPILSSLSHNLFSSLSQLLSSLSSSLPFLISLSPSFCVNYLHSHLKMLAPRDLIFINVWNVYFQHKSWCL